MNGALKGTKLSVYDTRYEKVPYVGERVFKVLVEFDTARMYPRFTKKDVES